MRVAVRRPHRADLHRFVLREVLNVAPIESAGHDIEAVNPIQQMPCAVSDRGVRYPGTVRGDVGGILVIEVLVPRYAAKPPQTWACSVDDIEGVLIAEDYARPSPCPLWGIVGMNMRLEPAPDLSPYLFRSSAFRYTSPDEQSSQRLRSLESKLAPSPHSLRVVRLIEGVDRHDVKGMRPTVRLINSYLAVVVHHRPSDGRMGGLISRFRQCPCRVPPSAGDDNGGHDAESVL